jgi:dTMP kinase
VEVISELTMMKEQGIFITLEGIEGVGKTTQLDYVAEFFRQAGRNVTITREPGGTSVGESIRSILLERKNLDICTDTELLMMFAARAQHLQQIIRPALQRNDVVISDRFTDASFAYQGAGRGIEKKKIEQLQDWVQAELRPEITFLLDAPVEIGLERAGKRSEPDRFESESMNFFNAVREEYLTIAKDEPERVFVIDATLSCDNVQHQISTVLKKLGFPC